MSRVLLASPDADFEGRVREALDHAEDLSRVPDGMVRAQLAYDLLPSEPGELPEVVVLGPGLAVSAALDLASTFDQQRPEISVVLVAEPAPELWPQALQAGVRDVVLPTADAQQIRAVLARASQTAEGRRRAMGATPPPVGAPSEAREAGRIITVTSSKGGSGKTTTAANLAVGLAGHAPGQVVLVDLDLQFGDVANALHLDPDRSIVDAAASLAADDPMLVKTFLDAHESGCYALCAPASPGDGERVGAEQAAQLVRQLSSTFRYVIVDTGPGLPEHTLAVLEESTDTVLVCGMDVSSVRGTRKVLDLLDELGMTTATRHLALNFVDKFAGFGTDDVVEILGVPVDVALPRSKWAPLASNRGVPLLQSGSKDPLARGLRRLVDRVGPTAPAGRRVRRSGRRQAA